MAAKRRVVRWRGRKERFVKALHAVRRRSMTRAVNSVLASVLACAAWTMTFAGSAQAHYIYTCPGFAHDPATHTYRIPADCKANPYTSPGTHPWLARQVPAILRGDGRSRPAEALGARARGKTLVEWLTDGVIRADTGLNGCTDYGRSIGWPLGDHMLNPYRRFGVWSYNQQQTIGWQGYLYADSAGRTVGSCARAPRVRSTVAAMVDEFFGRASREWKAGHHVDAMFNLGIALHGVQDTTVPSHVHPEVLTERLRIRSPYGVRQGLDAFPAWANANKEQYRLRKGGLYNPPANANGVAIANTPGGWAYWMAALSYPYFPWSSHWSAIPRSAARCDVTDFPVECRNASARLLRRAQRVSAGFVNYFFQRVGN